MNINKIFLFLTRNICKFSLVYKVLPYVRSLSDIRLVLYHGIGNGGDSCFKYLYDEISIEQFEKQINYLQYKYHLTSLNTAIKSIKENFSERHKPVCSISFDDGLRSVYLKAYPILKKNKIPATVFINTAVIDNNDMTDLHLLSYLLERYGSKKIKSYIMEFSENVILPPDDPFSIQEWYVNNYNHNVDLLCRICRHLCLNKREIAGEEEIYLQWCEIEEMSENGIMFCSHTHNHRPLAQLSINNINEEISLAYNIIKDHGYDTDFVSFPFGMKEQYGSETVTRARELGHKYVVEVGDGVNNSNKFFDKGILSRVCLGLVECNDAEMYSAIEMGPLIKTKLKSMVNRNNEQIN